MDRDTLYKAKQIVDRIEYLDTAIGTIEKFMNNINEDNYSMSLLPNGASGSDKISIKGKYIPSETLPQMAENMSKEIEELEKELKKL